MIEIKRILCPIDFSELSRRAVGHAVVLAHRSHAEIHALHVLPILPTMWAIPPTVNPDTLEPIAPHTFAAEMAALLAPATEAGITVETHVREGDPAREVAAYANTRAVDLVVMGTHGRHGLARMILGSVTERVLRTADCPVLTVCHAPVPAAPSGPSFRRILCPVDFAPPSLRALDYALALLGDGDGEVSVLYVNEPYYHAVLQDRASPTLDYDRFVEADLRRRLESIRPPSAQAPGRLRTLVRTGNAWEEILAAAHETPADLIVMGVHGRGALDIALFGSNTNQVVRRAECPVLTIAGRRASAVAPHELDREKTAV